MSIINPFLSASYISCPKNYVPFRNCITYVKQKSSQIPYSGIGQEKRLKLMEGLGMKKYAKFYRKRFVWDKLKGSVPLVYLEAIGVDLDTLSYCLELDQQEYINILSDKRSIPHFYFMAHLSSKFGLCYFENYLIPEEYRDEGKAIEFVNEILLDESFKGEEAWIYVNGIIKHHFTKRKGLLRTRYFMPSILIKRGVLITKLLNSKISKEMRRY